MNSSGSESQIYHTEKALKRTKIESPSQSSIDELDFLSSYLPAVKSTESVRTQTDQPGICHQAVKSKKKIRVVSNSNNGSTQMSSGESGSCDKRSRPPASKAQRYTSKLFKALVTW